MLRITTRKRWPGWTARLSSDAGIWEAGQTEVEAIGKLMITLDDAARTSRARRWLIFRGGIRIERP